MTSQVGDVAAALAYQIKKEIAENYFGRRKDLEEEREELLQEGKKILNNWESTISPLLIKIYELMISQEAGRALLSLIKKEGMFSSGNKKEKTPGLETISCSPPFAMTPKGKYQNLILTLYQEAAEKERIIFQEFQALQKKVIFYNEELRKFNSAYNLSDILSFIKGLECQSDLKGVLGENVHPLTVPLLEEKLLLPPLDLNREGLRLPAGLPPLNDIKKPLKKLLAETYEGHCSEIKKELKKR